MLYLVAGIGDSRRIHLPGSPLSMPRTTKCHPLRQTLDARRLGSAAVICAAALVCVFKSILKNFYCAISVCLKIEALGVSYLGTVSSVFPNLLIFLLDFDLT